MPHRGRSADRLRRLIGIINNNNKEEGRGSGGSSFVAVVKSTDLGYCHYSPHFHRLNRPRLGRVLAQGEMGSGFVIVAEIRTKSTAERGFIEHNQMVQSLASNRANHPFHIRSLQGERGVDSTSSMSMSRTCSRSWPKMRSRSRSGNWLKGKVSRSC